MRTLLTLLVTLTLAIPALAQEAQETTEEAAPAEQVQAPVLDIRPASEVVLEDFLWLNRLIGVFANTERDPNFRDQMALLAGRPVDLIERDVIIVTDTDPANPSALRTELRPRGFGFVFIDKDGYGDSDERRTLVKGIAFGYEDRPADHTTNGLEMGIDGWILRRFCGSGWRQVRRPKGVRSGNTLPLAPGAGVTSTRCNTSTIYAPNGMPAHEGRL